MRPFLNGNYTRRDFMTTLGLGVAALAVPGSILAGTDGKDKTKRPNFLIIMADDLASHELGCYGGKNVATPNIDKLAAEGLRMTHTFASEAICVPIRASLYTGLFPVRHGTSYNLTASKLDTKSVPHYLEPLGYRVGLTGKLHVRPRKVYPFEEVPGFEKNCTKNTADYTVDGIREFMTRDAKQPFCLFVGSTLPHGPWTVGDASHFPPDKLILPPTWVDTSDTREAFSPYCAEIEALDKQVGDTVKALEEIGQKDNTVLMFLGEQGSQFPGAKWTLYAPGVSSAMIVRWPGKVKPGSISDAMVQYEDILPTLIEAAGGAAETNLDGISFAAVLAGSKIECREYAYGIHNNTPSGPPYPIRSIRSKKYKLIFNLMPDEDYCMSWVTKHKYWKSWVKAAETNEVASKLVNRFLRRPAVELYDVEKDVWELNNLADNPKLANVRRELEQKLHDWMRQQGDTGADAVLLTRRQPRHPKRKMETRVRSVSGQPLGVV